MMEQVPSTKANDMSTRLYIRTRNKSFQLFENNYVPSSFIKVLQEQGLEYDPQKENTFKDFQVKDIQPILDEVKKEFINKIKTQKNIVNFSNYFFDKNGTLKDESLYFNIRMILENSYLFDFYNLIEFLKEDIDLNKSFCFDDKFVLKENAIITISMS